jgi:ribosomal-protein-alanine N-acetyltransferase
VSEAVIIPMRGGHIPDVLEIERASFGMPWSRNGFLSVITNPDALAYAAIIDEKVAGYVCAFIIGEDSEILKLAVRPEFRGRGIAKALNTRCIKSLKEARCQQVYLEVRRTNSAAINMYEGFGCRGVGVRKSYYSSPVEDALVMKRDL